jgi:hypothetical protein
MMWISRSFAQHFDATPERAPKSRSVACNRSVAHTSVACHTTQLSLKRFFGFWKPAAENFISSRFFFNSARNPQLEHGIQQRLSLSQALPNDYEGPRSQGVTHMLIPFPRKKKSHRQCFEHPIVMLLCRRDTFAPLVALDVQI